MVDAQAVPELVKLLSSTDLRICDQATWVLANIAGESPSLRDYVLEAGAISALVAYVGRCIGTRATKAGVWALKNLSKDSLPLTDFHWTMVRFLLCVTSWKVASPTPTQLSPALHILPAILDLDDDDALADACSVAACLCNGPVETTQTVLSSGAHTRLLRLTLHNFIRVSLPALTAIAGLLRGTTDRQTQALIDDGLLFSLNAALLSTENKTVFMACFAMSNVFVGPCRHVQAAIDIGVVKSLIVLATESRANSVKREASWALANALGASSSKPSIAHYMLAERCLVPLIDQLKVAESRAHTISILGAILCILEFTQSGSEAPGTCTMDLDGMGITLVILKLQHDADCEVRLLAQRIIQQFLRGQIIHGVHLAALEADMSSLKITHRRNLELDPTLEMQRSLKRVCLT